jgi:hypothetical protein
MQSEFLKVPDAIDARVAKYPGARFAVCPPVAADGAFGNVPGLKVENWLTP